MFALQRLDILSGQSLNPEDMAKRVAQACNAQRAGNDARVVNVVFFTGLGREVRPEKSSVDALGGAVESVLAFHREVEKLLGSMTLPRPVTPMVRLEDGETGMAWIDESWGPLSLQLWATPQKRTRVRLLCGDIARRLLGHRYGIPRYALVLTHPDQYLAIMRAAEAFYQNSRR